VQVGFKADINLAHIIRNHKTATARAITSLQTTSRWAVSGTPIQNSLTDFLGLFRFLHFKPYDDAQAFDDDILDFWRSKSVDEATNTFKKLLSCIMIRRTKTILELPSRVDKVIRVAFDPQEEEYYGRIERPLTEMLDEAAEGQNSPSGSWLNAIQQINKLRLVCNLGTFVPSHQPRLIQPMSDTSLAVLSARLSMGGQACAQCLNTIGSLPSGDELDDSTSSHVYYSVCHRLFCASCSILLRYQTPEPCGCADPSSPCPLLPLLPLLATPRFTPTGEASPSRMEMDGAGSISSKVRALVSQIKAYTSEKQ
jgi:SWI/SNF-related matrix-associated actin-dependent regulator of chromatin subfamily A3